MLGLLCPECSIVKTPPPPCIRSTRLYSCILQNIFKLLGIFAARKNVLGGYCVIFFGKKLIGTSLSEPHCYVANRGKRNALWCVRTRNFSTVIKIPPACDRNFYQFVVNLPIVFSSSQILRQFAWLRISQDASHFARRNMLAELIEQ